MTAASYLRMTVVAASIIATAACNSSKSPSTPDTAQPSSATPAPTIGTSNGATVAGLVINGGSASGMAMPMSVGMSGVTVKVSGTSLNVTTDATGRFSLTNVPAGQVVLQFSGAASGTMSLDDVGEHDTIDVEVHVNNGEVDDEQANTGTGAEAQLEGKIVSANPGAHTFVVGQVTVMVPTTATIAHGGQTLTFADLVAGARVHAKGSLTGSTLTATRIEVQQMAGGNGNGGNGNAGNGNGNGGNGNGGNGGNGNGDNGSEGENEIEFSGAVAGLSGSCPAITFTAGGHSVTTTQSTRFDTACASIAKGTKLEVKGTSATPGGVVTATRVSKEN